MRNRHIHLPLRHTAMELNIYLSEYYCGEGGRRIVREREVDEKKVRDDLGWQLLHEATLY